MNRRIPTLTLTLASLLWLSGCDLLGLEPASALAARKEAEGKAIGGACRHAGRAIEDCYALNKRADKAAVFAGWREMNDYMRENKIEVVKPELPSGQVPGRTEGGESAHEDAGEDTKKADDSKADKSAKPAARKPAGKN